MVTVLPTGKTACNALMKADWNAFVLAVTPSTTCRAATVTLFFEVGLEVG
jgi:hypothetical protein